MPGWFTIGPGVRRAATVSAYERKPGDPVVRPLKVYTIDPTALKVEGAIASIEIPYEPLAPGPVGALLEVDPHDGEQLNSAVDLEDPRILIRGGLDPSPSDHHFHQQMVYAVTANLYAAFRAALGRLIPWGFDRTRLRLRPHVPGEGANACYEKAAGELRFGYYPAPAAVRGRNLPGAPVFTCLSHDIIAHEFTHAVIDGLRSKFTLRTGPDVLGFHEGFADIIAVLQHFRYPKVLATQIAKHRGELEQAVVLTNIAANFGLTTSSEKTSLRSAIDATGAIRYSRSAEPHQTGTVLVTAIFAAMLNIYRRKTDRYIRLAAHTAGPLPEPLVDILAEEATKLANSCQQMCLRALDYCPPVDLELGEFLRALLTVDHDLVLRDPWGYREALIDSFAAHGIYPSGVAQLAEDALLWRPPSLFMDEIRGLSFADLRFRGDPSLPAGADELERQARVLGEFVTRPENLHEFGLAAPGDPLLHGDSVDPPCIESIRTSRRVGPDGRVLFDLVAEVTQRREARGSDFYGGSTVILGPRGEVRYAISKNILREDRLQRQLEFQRNMEA